MNLKASTQQWLGRSIAAFLLLGFTGVLAACGGSDDEPEGDPTPSAAISSSDESSDSQDDEDDAEQDASGQSSGDSSGPRPTIVSFSTPENIDCHNGNFQEFSASWETQDATKTTISIDGGGIYETYAASASTSLPFNCSSSHTFKLTALDAAGNKATKSITLQPRNAQSGDDEEEDES